MAQSEYLSRIGRDCKPPLAEPGDVQVRRYLSTPPGSTLKAASAAVPRSPISRSCRASKSIVREIAGNRSRHRKAKLGVFANKIVGYSHGKAVVPAIYVETQKMVAESVLIRCPQLADIVGRPGILPNAPPMACSSEARPPSNASKSLLGGPISFVTFTCTCLSFQGRAKHKMGMWFAANQ